MNHVDPSQIRSLLMTTCLYAGRVARLEQKTTSIVRDIGGGGGITTQADENAQDIMARRFQEAHPNIPIVGEEGNTLTICPEEAFIFDPIDGSAPYKAGAPDWTTTAAYRSPTHSIGVIYQPALDLLYVTSEKGEVEVRYHDLALVRTLKRFAPRKPQWRICMPFARDFSDASLDVFLEIIKDKRVRAPENLSCNTAHFIRLFEGWDEGVIMWAKIWDSEAAVAMAKMLGIIVTDFNGNKPDFSVIEPQRLVFARGEEVLDCIVSRTKHWPSPEEEMRKD